MVKGQVHRGKKNCQSYFYAVNSITQKVIDQFWWALVGWCGLKNGRLSSIVKKMVKGQGHRGQILTVKNDCF